jgi:hypothetical protein
VRQRSAREKTWYGRHLVPIATEVLFASAAARTK